FASPELHLTTCHMQRPLTIPVKEARLVPAKMITRGWSRGDPTTYGKVAVFRTRADTNILAAGELLKWLGNITRGRLGIDLRGLRSIAGSIVTDSVKRPSVLTRLLGPAPMDRWPFDRNTFDMHWVSLVKWLDVGLREGQRGLWFHEAAAKWWIAATC